MKRILVALDTTPPSLKAIQYVAEIVPFVPDAQVLLLSIATGIHRAAEQLALPDSGADLPLDHQHEKAQIEAIQEHAYQLLVERGMAPEHITRRIKVISRGIARDILDEARATESDTLVIGRRGLSKIREMVVGSVSSEIIHAGVLQAIWVVE